MAEVAALPGWVCQFEPGADMLKVRKPIFAGEAAAKNAVTPAPAAVAPTNTAVTATA